jgi:hypothetical protein
MPDPRDPIQFVQIFDLRSLRRQPGQRGKRLPDGVE